MDKRKTVRGLTEAELLELIPGRNEQYPHIIRGIGDDCAVVGFNKGTSSYLLLTQDSLISGRHFSYDHDDPYYVGWKALARSVSDIAAMGGTPHSSLVSYGIPSDTPVEWLKRVFEGLHACASQYSCPIIGGDMASTAGELFLSTTCMGTVDKDAMVLRSGAMVGDMLCVTGTLGGSITGKHLSFEPRVAHAQWLVAHAPVSSMIDLSDGMAKDLFHIAESSQVGFNLDDESLPLSEAISACCDDRDSAVHHALYDGEDYELLFTVSLEENQVKMMCQSFQEQFSLPCTIIGRCVAALPTVVLYKQGRMDTTLTPGGFEHFC